MMEIDISGDGEIILNLLNAKSGTFARVRRAVEQTAVRMGNHARAGHAWAVKGMARLEKRRKRKPLTVKQQAQYEKWSAADPHLMGRFRTQTGALVASIFPGGPGKQAMQWEQVTEDAIVGLFGINNESEMAVEITGPQTPMDYAEEVEQRYPFIFPAMIAYIDDFKKRVADAAPGGRGMMGMD